MPPSKPPPKPSPSSGPDKDKTANLDYKTIAAEFAAAKRRKEAQDASAAASSSSPNTAAAAGGPDASPNPLEALAAQTKEQHEKLALRERVRASVEAARKSAYQTRWAWTAGFWVWLLLVHVVGIAYFTSGFLLTRLVLDQRSECAVPPTVDGTSSSSVVDSLLPAWKGKGTVDGGCWHPRTFERAVVVVIDALRYDFAVPVGDGEAYHDKLTVLYEMAKQHPDKAFLRPFIADPPTATMQRLKGLTTGTLPTFVDLGNSFSGTAIDEDNLLVQFREAGKRVVHLGDDTWEALFPGYFHANLSRAYDSFNVWDLHTVDNGVIDNIFPAMERRGEWDVLIGHCLGVDHAGHRYGPSHPEMAKKLRQMDKFIRDLVATMDDKTVLIVMGDHGMDGKGDHGGESADEIESALWMYSPKGIFGRTKPEHAAPPPNAKVRPVNQIDFVPTLALLMGIPIPFNNLGRPIEEAFAVGSGKGVSWANLAAAERVAAAGIKRYQSAYFAARGIQPPTGPGTPAELWDKAEALVSAGAGKKQQDWAAMWEAFAAYQEKNLEVCRALWARFDVKNMVFGIVIMALGVVALLAYVSRGDDDEDVVEDEELELAEKSLEMQGIKAPVTDIPEKRLVASALLGAVPVFFGGMVSAYKAGTGDWYRGSGIAALTSILVVLVRIYEIHEAVPRFLPKTFWGWMAVVFTVSQSVGFASNSFTIWEDSILLFFLTTFGVASALAALRLPDLANRSLAIYHSLVFVLLTRVASYSKLCREEQIPYCTSTYYASATSSTSAPWQLLIPFLAAVILPSIIKAYLHGTRSYEGLAPVWIGYVLRAVLAMSALYWLLDAADNNNWIPNLPSPHFLKNLNVYLAQMLLGVSLVAGTTAFAWAPPCVSVRATANPSNPSKARVAILGYANTHGARYLLLPLNLLAACFLLSKPMGAGALAIFAWQVLALLEILDLLSLKHATGPIGPVVLAMLGTFHFFKTGHQAILSTIQWDSAFIPLFTIRYPWSPLVVTLNTFAGPILAAAFVPLLVLWKAGPKRKGLLDAVSKTLGCFIAYFATEALATMLWAGHLRRHLMLYRVFCPRFMTAAAAVLVVDVVGVLVALAGVRGNTVSVGDVFGWAK
ncbi:hypothetical protein VTJ04DRAFT_3755 [Mycothermus thermophilus]|uniref:uncharacterized protein n=1 Tax=Humicola insolens TaxID=85995 RepID=UPI003741EC5D